MENRLRSPSAFIAEIRKMFARNSQKGVFIEAALCADLAEALDSDIEAIRWMERVTARTHVDDPGRPPRLGGGRPIVVEAAGPNVFLFPVIARRPTTGGSAA